MPDKQNYFYLFALMTIVWCISWIIDDNFSNFGVATFIVIFVFGIAVNAWAAHEYYRASVRRYRNKEKG